MALLRRDTLADTGFTTKRGAHMMHGCGARKLRKLVRSGFGAGSASQSVMLFSPRADSEDRKEIESEDTPADSDAE